MNRTSRRQFLGASVAAAVVVKSTPSVAQEDTGEKSDKLRITIAGYPYDRVKGLMNGRVQIDRCEVNFEIGRIGEMNTHVFSVPQTREVSEVGLLPFILAHANEGFRDYALIPVFPLRVFHRRES